MTKQYLGTRKGCNGLAADTAEDVGWQEGDRNWARKEVEHLNSLRLPNETSLLDSLELGNVIENPEERCVFPGNPTGCQDGIPRTDCRRPRIN